MSRRRGRLPARRRPGGLGRLRPGGLARLRPGGLALILTAAIVVAGCGIPTQNAPSTISKEAIPFNL
ncbi:MAG TPA: hypothetical protein VG205_09025, partial [Acidimicrobiales bacterium]|nr:hypothetical protein [Acidimicrobiales bacterium]